MKNIKHYYSIKFVLSLFLLSTLGCTTDDLNPTLSQSKNVEGSIISVNNLYALIKGSHDIMTGSGYYGEI